MNSPVAQMDKKPRIKRFYQQVAVEPAGENWQVLLDGKPVRTPAKELLLLPTRALADGVAAEWSRQGEYLDLDSMYYMQFSCAALDYTQLYRQDVEAEALAYITTDLLCYRAEDSHELAHRQGGAWNPVIAWAEQRYGIKLTLIEGIMPVPQEQDTVEAIGQLLKAHNLFPLTALWLMTRHTGSLLLALAVYEKYLSATQAFTLSRIDETYQNEQWGEDEEARRRREAAAAEMGALGNFVALLQ